MKNSVKISICTCLLLIAATGAQAYDRKVYTEAVDLYRSGMYSRARTLFLSQKDPVCRDYATLCAIKSGSPDCGALVKAMETNDLKSVLNSQVHWEYGRRLFAQGQYIDAYAEFKLVKPGKLSKSDKIELAFKQGYCEYTQRNLKEAAAFFDQVTEAPYTKYLASSQFALGCINYQDSQFQTAIEWFSLASSDPRYKDVCAFYISDCLFMLEDYNGAIAKGESIFSTSNRKRQAYLSKILSESYLVLGQAAKAKEYLVKENEVGDNLSYEDYFRRASVLYASGEYSAAIENFTKMVNPDDSIGQIACYQLGYSYIKTKNKVAALDAFKTASRLEFDHQISEDSFFNYAKLSFELNNDEVPFHEYTHRFPNAGKKDEVFRYLALSALKTKNYSLAVSYFDEIETLCEEDQLNYTKACFQRSSELLTNGAYKDAVKYLKCVPHFLPKNDPLARTSRYWLADTYYRIGEYKESLKLYTDLYNSVSAVNADSQSVLLPYNMAFCNYRLKDFQSSAKWFDVYLNTQDKTARQDALIRRADCDFERADYASAAASYQKVVAEYPNGLYAPYYQSVSYSLLGKKKERANALEAVLFAKISEPYYLECLNALGYAYCDLNRNEDAGNVFAKLGDEFSDRTAQAMSYMGLGMVARNTGNFSEANSKYKKVVSIVPGSSYSEDALSALLAIAQMNGTPEEYLKYIDSIGLGSTQSESDRRRLIFSNAQQIYQDSNYAKAAKALVSYLDKYPSGENTTDALYYLADSYKHLSKKELALEFFDKCIQSSDKGSSYELALMNAAALSFDLQKYSESQQYYKTLLTKAKIASNIPLAQIGIMRSSFAAKDYAIAVPSCEWIVSHSEDKALVREAKLIQAKSCLSLSRRTEAFEVLKQLAKEPTTAEGAEASVMILQSYLDSGEFNKLEPAVYDFSSNCADQTYWLARAYILLADGFLENGNPAQAKVTYESIRDGYVPASESDDILEIVNQKLAAIE